MPAPDRRPLKAGLWHRLFLIERPSIGLALFRVTTALTVGFYVLPTFCHLPDTYLSTAFKTYNLNFFTLDAVRWVQSSPDWLVKVMVAAFCCFWLAFLVGWRTQLSCVGMVLGCYYFYALNHIALGHALTWDILMVTLVLLCFCPYLGDYWSLDCLFRRDLNAYARRRPFFIQRLLQMQIASTYFYTGLHKISGSGNWLTDNPIYYLMHQPPPGVTKWFMIREYMGAHPELCYAMGLIIVGVEILMPFLLWFRPTRMSGIYLGILFHITLMLTLDVPAIFFFLFTPMLFLFINPERVLYGIEQRRRRNTEARRPRLVYDGRCRFCRASVTWLRVMDLFDAVEMVDCHQYADPARIHPRLTPQQVNREVCLVEPDGRIFGGYAAFRRLVWKLPMLYPAVTIMYFPGAGVIGPLVYRWVANNRYLFRPVLR